MTAQEAHNQQQKERFNGMLTQLGLLYKQLAEMQGESAELLSRADRIKEKIAETRSKIQATEQELGELFSKQLIR